MDSYWTQPPSHRWIGWAGVRRMGLGVAGGWALTIFIPNEHILWGYRGRGLTSGRPSVIITLQPMPSSYPDWLDVHYREDYWRGKGEAAIREEMERLVQEWVDVKRIKSGRRHHQQATNASHRPKIQPDRHQ